MDSRKVFTSSVFAFMSLIHASYTSFCSFALDISRLPIQPASTTITPPSAQMIAHAVVGSISLATSNKDRKSTIRSHPTFLCPRSHAPTLRATLSLVSFLRDESQHPSGRTLEQAECHIHVCRSERSRHAQAHLGVRRTYDGDGRLELDILARPSAHDPCDRTVVPGQTAIIGLLDSEDASGRGTDHPVRDLQ